MTFDTLNQTLHNFNLQGSGQPRAVNNEKEREKETMTLLEIVKTVFHRYLIHSWMQKILISLNVSTLLLTLFHAGGKVNLYFELPEQISP